MSRLASLVAAPFLAAGVTCALEAQGLPLIPWPASVERDSGSFVVGPSVPIVMSSPRLAGLGAYAAGLVAEVRGRRPPVRRAAAGTGIVLRLAPGDSARGDESYRLEIGAHGVRISAPRRAGLFLGLQTFRQLLAAGDTLPALRIADSPRFAYRGMHLDVGRHVFPVAFIKRYIDLMSRFKLNTFHWHLTDDQGWRIQIRRYPRLTSVGAWRKETVVGQHFDPYVGDGKRYGGYYTQAEIRDIVRYAAARHVTIVPEIEMPGHSQAALAAYPSLACTPGPFEVSTVWGVDEDIYCPSEATFRFLRNVLSEVMDLFPGKYVHIGGDEAPKARWKASPLAQRVIRREGLKDEAELQSWFIARIERFLRSRGRRLIGWDEILEGGLAPGATVMSWRGIDGGLAAARQSHDVIMTPGSHLYFDHAQGDPALEPPSIGGNTPLDRVYGFEPVPPALSAGEARHVIGAQANLWTEYIESPAQAEFMAFPRLLALAEVVWSPKEARDWASFTARLPAVLTMLDRLDVNYRVPHVTGLERDRLTLSDSATVELATLLPESSEIRYTLDGTLPDTGSSRYTGPLRLPVSAEGIVVTATVFTRDGRASPPRSARFRHTTLRSAESLPEAGVAAGLRVAYFERAFPNARAVAASTDGDARIADSVALQGRERAETYGLRFSGYVRVPASGLYTFTLASDDGSVLMIGDRMVVDNDGWHSETERSGMIALAAGLHPISIAYVQGSGGAALRALVEGEDGRREPLAGAWLLH